MRLFLSVILLAFSSYLAAQDDLLMQDGITKPALSLRCKDLLKERGDKVKIQQRLNALLQRNQDILKRSPKASESVKSRLHASQIKIKNELHLANLSIETMEEGIVRTGCPGINLE